MIGNGYWAVGITVAFHHGGAPLALTTSCARTLPQRPAPAHLSSPANMRDLSARWLFESYRAPEDQMSLASNGCGHA